MSGGESRALRQLCERAPEVMEEIFCSQFYVSVAFTVKVTESEKGWSGEVALSSIPFKCNLSEWTS